MFVLMWKRWRRKDDRYLWAWAWTINLSWFYWSNKISLNTYPPRAITKLSFPTLPPLSSFSSPLPFFIHSPSFHFSLSPFFTLCTRIVPSIFFCFRNQNKIMIPFFFSFCCCSTKSRFCYTTKSKLFNPHTQRNHGFIGHFFSIPRRTRKLWFCYIIGVRKLCTTESRFYCAQFLHPLLCCGITIL